MGTSSRQSGASSRGSVKKPALFTASNGTRGQSRPPRALARAVVETLEGRRLLSGSGVSPTPGEFVEAFGGGAFTANPQPTKRQDEFRAGAADPRTYPIHWPDGTFKENAHDLGMVYAGTSDHRLVVARGRRDEYFQRIMDPSFGFNGRVTLGGLGYQRADAVAVDRAGRIVVAGAGGATASATRQLLTRLTPDGVVDGTFADAVSSGKGVSLMGDGRLGGAVALVIDASDRLLTVATYTHADGTSDVAVARYLVNGTPDASFGTGGVAVVDLGQTEEAAAAMLLLPDGRIAVAGTSGNEMAVAMLRSAGTLDPTFGSAGVATVDFTNINTSMPAKDHARSLAYVPGPTPHLLLGGDNGRDFLVARLTLTGTLTSGWGSTGTGRTVLNPRNATTAQTRMGQLLVIDPTYFRVFGTSNGDFAHAQLTLSSGTTHTTYANTNTNPYRFNRYGSTIRSTTNVLLTNLGGDDRLNAVVLESNLTAPALIGTAGPHGDADFAVLDPYVDFLRQGTTLVRDHSDPNLGRVTKTLTQPDGKTLVFSEAAEPYERRWWNVGFTTTTGDYDYTRLEPARETLLTRYNADGSIDPTFAAGGQTVVRLTSRAAHGENTGFKTVVNDAVIGSDGAIYIGTTLDVLYPKDDYGFSNRYYNADVAVLKLNADGSIDRNWHGITPLGGAERGWGRVTLGNRPFQGLASSLTTNGDDALAAIRLRADGTVLGVGTSGGDDLFNATGAPVPPNFVVAKWATSGSSDPNFGTDASFYNAFGTSHHTTVYFPDASAATPAGLAERHDGRIVVAGSVTSGGVPRLTLAGFSAAGAVDVAFGGSGLLDGPQVGSVLGVTLAGTLADTLLVVTADPVAGGQTAVRRHAISLAGGTISTQTLEFGGNFASVSPRDVSFDASSDTTYLGGVATLADGSKAVIASRFATDGTLDATFGTNGVVTAATGTAASINAVAASVEFARTAAGPVLTIGGGIKATVNHLRASNYQDGASLVQTPTGNVTPPELAFDARLAKVDAGGNDTPTPVNRPPVAVLADASVDENAVVTLDATASTDPDGPSDIVSYMWDLNGDGDFSDAAGPTVSFSKDLPGVYVVAVRVTDTAGQTSVASARVTVNDLLPVAQDGAVEVVYGEPVTLTGSAANVSGDLIVAYDWDTDGDGVFETSGQTLTFTPATPGVTVVRYRATDDDGDTAVGTYTLTVTAAAPTADAGGDVSVSEGSSLVLSGTAAAAANVRLASVAWDLNGDGTFDVTQAVSDASATLTVPFDTDRGGVYTAVFRATDEFGQSTDAAVSVTVVAINPSVSLGNDLTTDEGTAVTIVAKVTLAPGDTVAEIAWDATGDGHFVAGGPALEFNPDLPGEYVVTVRVTDDDGRVVTDSITVSVSDLLPVADAGGDVSTGLNEPVTLTAGGFSPSGDAIVAYAWDTTGDGTFDTSGQTITFSAASAGTYTLTLRVTDDDGDTATDTVRVIVSDLAPVVTVPAASGDEGTAIMLSGSAASPNGTPIVAYAWDLDGDGTYEIEGQNASFLRGLPGTYGVSLRATDGLGRVGYGAAVVTVNDVRPTVTASGPYAVDENQTVTLVASASTAVGDTIVLYAWDLDHDGTFETEWPSVTFVRDLPGIYTVAVRVTDSDGDTATDTTSVVVNDLKPTADAGGDRTAVVGETITLTAHGTAPDGDTIVEYAWDLNHAGTFSMLGESLTLTPAAGTYAVTLRVTDDDGDVAYDTVTLVVSTPSTPPAPIVALTLPAFAVRQQHVTFTADVSNAVEVRWTFGDGAAGAWQAVTGATATVAATHAFTTAGPRGVTIEARNAAGQVTVTSATLHVTVTALVNGQLHVGGTGGHDVMLAVGCTQDKVKVLAPDVSGSFAASEVYFYGGDGNDVINVASCVKARAFLFGGDGHDLLRAASIRGNVLSGGDGNDLLVGSDGRDILIGGHGSDRIIGHREDDILVAGHTVYDANPFALRSALAEWTSGRTYADRVANLRGSGTGARLNGNVFFTPDVTVFDDGVLDILTGNHGRDWFLFNNDAGVKDWVTDLSANEFADDLDFIETDPTVA